MGGPEKQPGQVRQGRAAGQSRRDVYAEDQRLQQVVRRQTEADDSVHDRQTQDLWQRGEGDDAGQTDGQDAAGAVILHGHALKMVSQQQVVRTPSLFLTDYLFVYLTNFVLVLCIDEINWFIQK